MEATDHQVAKDTILRSWKDEQFYNSLPDEVRREIPARPEGADGSMLSDDQLEAAAGGLTPGAATIAAAAGKAALTGMVGGAASWGITQVLPD